jgi:hypothetical protein
MRIISGTALLLWGAVATIGAIPVEYAVQGTPREVTGTKTTKTLNIPGRKTAICDICAQCDGSTTLRCKKACAKCPENVVIGAQDSIQLHVDGETLVTVDEDNVVLDTNLVVTGTTKIDGSLLVTGPTTMQGRTVVDDSLTVTGPTTMQGPTVVDDSLTVKGDVAIGGAFNCMGEWMCSLSHFY